ncbi:MAG: ATP-binding cassette domain-containing protein, partial [Anaerolineae bacterium]|nr:ATP-binding cassette domain-containing protein [Anaerolineae bacterium]NIO00491.1 ATP-binding cassette domain-containing protein [Anaerolineae bacterium]
MFEHLRGSSGLILKAVDGVDLEIQQAQTLGLVGESGSGKTTLARAVVGLVRRTGGSIELLDELLPAGLKGRSLDTLTRLQIVFQSPQEALNPYLSVGQSLRRPLQRLLGLSAKEAEGHVLELLEAVHLSDDYARRLPSQLSGGEKQRVAIARAFASNPDLLLADEPVSSLDVSVQASILNLLSELQSENGSA